MTNREYRLKGPYVVLSFLLLLFCLLRGVIVNSVLKSRFSIISAPGVQGRNMVYGLRAQSPKYDRDQGSEERAQDSEEWDQGSQGF